MANTISFNITVNDNFSGPLKEFEQQTKQVEKRVQDFNKNFIKAGRTMTRMGKLMTRRVSAPLGALGVLSIKTAKDFESSMIDIGSYTKATAEELDLLRKSAFDLSKGTLFKPQDAISGIRDLMMSGMDANDAISQMTNVFSLATASSLKMDDALKITSSIIRTVGNDSSKVNSIMDKLIYGFTHSDADLLSLTEAFKVSGNAMQSFGFDSNQTIAALIKMSEAGFIGGKAGESLAQMMMDLKKPNEDMKIVMEALNLQFKDEHGNLKDILSVTQQLQKIPPQIFDRIFSSSGVQAVETLLNNSGSSINEIVSGLSDVSGLMDKISKEQSTGLDASLSKLSSAFSALKLTIIGEDTLKDITSFIEILTQKIEAFSNVSPGLMKFFRWFILLGALLGPTILALGQFIVLFGLMMKFGALGVILKGIAGGLALIGSALFMNPIGFAITGLVAASAAVYYYWDDIMGFVERVTNMIKESAIVQFLSDPLTGIKENFNRTMESGRERFGGPSLFESAKSALGFGRSERNESEVTININDPGNHVESVESTKNAPNSSFNLGVNMFSTY